MNVYEQHHLLDDKTILAHGIYATESERERLLAAGTVISHCPTSNLFLGSGLLPYKEFQEQGIALALGTDVGAGTSFSMWKTMAEGVKVSKLRQQQVLPEALFHGATLGGAKSLGLGDRIGSLEPGKEADFQVIDPNASSLFARRLPYCDSERQLLSSFIFHCDDRNLKSLWIQGKEVFQRD